MAYETPPPPQTGGPQAPAYAPPPYPPPYVAPTQAWPAPGYGGMPPFGYPSPPPPRRKRWPFALAALGVVVVLALAFLGFFIVARGEPDRLTFNRPPAAQNPPGSERPAAAEGTIQTASGSFAISDVVTGDRYPKGCTQSPNTFDCTIAAPGYQVLLLQLAPQGDAAVEDVNAEGKEAYVVSSDGDRTASFMWGWSTTDGGSKEAMVGFTPRASAHDFTLHWPDNDPIKLPV